MTIMKLVNPSITWPSLKFILDTTGASDLLSLKCKSNHFLAPMYRGLPLCLGSQNCQTGNKVPVCNLPPSSALPPS